MRSILVLVLICTSIHLAKADEAYKRTLGQLANCLGLQVREAFELGGRQIISPDVLEIMVKKKCGYLEDQANEEFLAFVDQQVGRAMPPKEKAEAMLKITLWQKVSSPSTLHRLAVDAYRGIASR